MKRVINLLFLFTVLGTSCEKDPLISGDVSTTRKDFIVTGETGAGIYYHDVDPDWEKHGLGLVNDTFNMDVNGDHIIDLSVKYTTFSTAGEYDQQTTVSCYNGAYISLAPKNQGDSISAFSNWTSSTSLLCYTKISFASGDTASIGQWQGKENKYLGVRIIKDGHAFYGWIRMSLLVPPATVYVQQITVKDFACRIAD